MSTQGQVLRDVTASPRTLLFSSRNYQQVVWRCGQVEFENVVQAIDQVDLVAPNVIERMPGRVLRKAQRVSRRMLGVDFSFVPRLEPVRLTRDYEVFCFYVQGLADLDWLDLLPGWRKHCRKAVCVVEEIWLRELGRWGARTLKRLAEFDLIVATHRATVQPLEALVGRRCEWSPAAVDTLRFFPGLQPPQRTIDVFAMGRRSDITHRPLLEHATKHGWTYLFDTLEPRRVREGDHEQHRAQLAELVKRSRYFLANRGRIDAVDDTGDQEEFGLRSFEGAAGGAVLIGHAPSAEHAKQMFDWPDAHIHVPFNSTEMADVIAALDRDPDRIARIRRDNVVNMLRRHDLAYRWANILAWLDIAPSARLAQRTARLEELAALTQGSVSTVRRDLSISAE